VVIVGSGEIVRGLASSNKVPSPFVSVTVTFTAGVPLAAGTQTRDAVFPAEQPAGSRFQT
jgi:hypothetical protein